MQSTNSLRTLNTEISADTVRSLIESYIRSLRTNSDKGIHNDEDVVSIKFNTEALNNQTIIPIEFKLRKDQEVEAIVHNG